MSPEDDLKRYPLIHLEERLQFAAFRWGLGTGFVIGLGVGLIVVVAAVAVFS